MRGHVQGVGPRKWRLFIDIGPDPHTKRRRQRTRTVEGTRRDADRALVAFITEAATGRIGNVDKITVGQLCDRWLDHRRASLEPNTIKGYESKLRTLIAPNLADVPIAKIRPGDLDGVYDHLHAQGHSPTSIGHVHAILRTAFEQAVAWEWLDRNPALRATPPERDLVDDVEFDDALMAKAVAAAPGRLNHMAELAGILGCREGEICGFQWSDFDRHAHTIAIRRRAVNVKGAVVIRPRTKNRGVRANGLDRRSVARLRLLHYEQRQQARACNLELADDAFIFSETPDGRPLSPAVVSSRWSRHKTKLGIPYRFHDLRHWHASTLQDEGAQTARVAKRVGHSRVSTTSDMYTHVMRANDHDLAEIAARKLR